MVGENYSMTKSDKNSKDDPIDIPLHIMIKHPLKHPWGFWMYTNQTKSWEENLVKLTTFDTVEDFWCLYHYIKSPSELLLGQDYAVFKNDIRPMWEDTANRRGGRLLISFEKKRNISLDKAWLYVVLLLIGENFENSDSICGTVINVRTKNKIGIWVGDAHDKKANLEIGHKLKGQLSLDGALRFHKHNSANHSFTI